MAVMQGISPNLARQGGNESGKSGSVRPDEVARFDRLAAQWWDPAGPMRALHDMNPMRVGWIDGRIPAGSRILDVGCGAGLASEALAGLGHAVLGLDAAPEAIVAARAHAEGRGLPLEYRAGAAEALLAEGMSVPVITALEVIEHVSDAGAFLALMAGLLEPGGRLFVSTLNRTARSLVVAKWGAEYVVRMLPVGTHEWGRFVTPGELGTLGRRAGLRLAATAGMTWSPRLRTWALSRDLSINYIAMLTTQR